MGGIFELPSGEVEPNESLADAVKRELAEETGLVLNTIDSVLPTFDYESKGGQRTRQFNFVISVRRFTEIRLLEHDRFTWASRENLSSFEITDGVRTVLQHYWTRR